MGMVLRQAAYPVLLGAGAGTAMAFVALRWVHSLFNKAPAIDSLALGASLLLILFAAALPAVLPARRAASTDPVRVLRTE